MAAPAAHAQGSRPAFPQRPIRVLVPFGPGGVIDVVARILAEPLGRRLGQTVVVENMPGAGSSIAARVVARAAPDGHTLLLNGASHAVLRVLYPDAGLDPVGDFATVALLGEQPFVLAVHPGVPATDVAGLLAWLRARPGEANFATAGVGTAAHLSGELLKRLAGVDFTVVTYRGVPQAMLDLVAGRADLMIDSQTVLAPPGREGRVRLLAVTTARRSQLLPDLPTLAEAGVTGFAASSWQALHAPAATPAPVLAQLAAAVAGALAEPEVQRRYADAGVEPLAGEPMAFMRAETEKWSAILRETGARP
jgi:tripartite-type tricarboxylate transporter receptor subunit TctC